MLYITPISSLSTSVSSNKALNENKSFKSNKKKLLDKILSSSFTSPISTSIASKILNEKNIHDINSSSFSLLHCLKKKTLNKEESI
ncbi:hypothetical protein H8356DRAFT_1273536 [Neocallimastix lanati (nom. inval.)]|nr:hypothetical protein H8356DRAFT_1273536 [Neocallimastix sp. JGI-2020a]